MVEGRGRPRFLLESAEAPGIGARFRQKHFDRHVASEPRIVRAVHLAHAAVAQRRSDFINADEGPGCESHRISPKRL